MVFKSKAKPASEKPAGAKPKPAAARKASADAAAGEAAGVDDTAARMAASIGGDDEGPTEGKKAKEVLNEYDVLEPGTIIGDQHFPLQGTDKKPVKKGEEMVVRLTSSDAQRHQLRGVRLTRRKSDKQQE